MTLPFEPCSSICISGQTESGKTQWVYKFLTHINDMYSKDPPSKISYCYGIHQDLFEQMERSVPHFYSKQGLPTVEELGEFTRDKQHKLIIKRAKFGEDQYEISPIFDGAIYVSPEVTGIVLFFCPRLIGVFQMFNPILPSH